MSDGWLVVAAVGAATIAIKAAGPLVLGPRTLPRGVVGIVALLAPVLLTAFVVVQTVGGNESIEIDARLPGVVAGGAAILVRAPLVIAMAIAAVVTGSIYALV